MINCYNDTYFVYLQTKDILCAPFFCSSVFVQYNTQKRKSAKNGEGLGTPIT